MANNKIFIKITTTTLLATILLIVSGCNNSQENKQNEQSLSDSLTTKNESVENYYEPIRQSINLFTLESREGLDVVFTSLSDIYPLSSEDSDTLALPDIEEKGIDAAQYFTLDGKYRERFLSKTNISETDSVFVYDYSKNKLASFLVKNLKVAALINIYEIESDWPYPRYYYMIGFEIDKRKIKEFSDEYYSDVLIYVGKENPFAREKLTPII